MTAPASLVGSLVIAAALAPAGYSSTRDTISALAQRGQPHRWVMSLGLVLLGASHVVTASGLHAAPARARLTLAVGGVSTVLVAAFPLPRSGGSALHNSVAGVAFAALALWPAFAVGGHGKNGGRRECLLTAGLLSVLVVAFLASPSASEGLFERVAAVAEALGPLVLLGLLAGRREA